MNYLLQVNLVFLLFYLVYHFVFKDSTQLLLCLTLFSFKSYPVYSAPIDNSDVTVQDTIPPTVRIDTVTTFDPATGEETVTIVRLDPAPKTAKDFLKIDKSKNVIDTVTIFDQATYQKTIIIVKHITGVIDTLPPPE